MKEQEKEKDNEKDNETMHRNSAMNPICHALPNQLICKQYSNLILTTFVIWVGAREKPNDQCFHRSPHVGGVDGSGRGGVGNQVEVFSPYFATLVNNRSINQRCHEPTK